MGIFDSLLTGILVFIILLGPLMFIHELGHFWAAKRAGIRVEEFGLGFPPRAITLGKRGDTTYTLNWLPIGAFVRMTGEELPDDPHSFAAQPKRWRLITLLAGPFMNFLGAFVILAVAYLFFATQPSEFRYRITSVREGGAAAAVGIKAGDVIVSANGVDLLQRLGDPGTGLSGLDVVPLKEQAQSAIGKELTVVVDRPTDPASSNSYVQQVELKGQIPADVDFDTPLGVGIAAKVLKSDRIIYSAPQAFLMAGEDIVNVLTGIVRAPVELIRQTMPAEMARPVSVVGITQMGVALIEDRDTQGLFPFIRFAGLISLVLGFTNLLPFPALDGGRILFIVIEWIRGRRVDPVREQWVHAVGMMILLGLSAVIIVLDIVRPISFR